MIPEIRLTLRIPSWMCGGSLPTGAFVAAGFVALNLLLFVPLYLIVANENNFWPFFPLGHPRGPYDWSWPGLGRSTYEYAMQLFVRRHNKDLFRVSADWVFLLSSLIFAARFAGDRWRACDGAARMPRLHRPVGVHGVQRLHSRALRPPRHAARRCPHARQRVDFRARHLGTGRRPLLRRPALRGGGARHAGGALSRRRLALGGRPRPASRGRRVGSRQRLPPAVVVVVRHSAGRPGHSTSSQACVPELAAVAGRVVHCPGSGRLRGARRGQPGGDDARAPSRHLPVVGRVVRGHAVGRRRLPCRATGTDAQGPGRVERAGAPDVHALRHRSRARRRIPG